MRLLLDEMYGPALSAALRNGGIEATSIIEARLAGASDAQVFAAALATDSALLTENVADFVRIAADHVTAGRSHPGVVIALSSRFSLRPSGMRPLFDAIVALHHDDLRDRIVFLDRRPDG